jgi:DNA recombination protein RmuC
MVRKRLQTGRGNLVKRVDDIRRLGAKTKKTIARDLLDATNTTDDDYLLEDFSEDLANSNEDDSEAFDESQS